MIVPTRGYPPNYDVITGALPAARGWGVIFAYGGRLYIPFADLRIPAELLEHEDTHRKQQIPMGPEEWWRRYIADPEFRQGQEIEAYHAQWKHVLKKSGRVQATRVLANCVADLTGPLYGLSLDTTTARMLITSMALT